MWIQITREGEFGNSGFVQVLDLASHKAMVSNFSAPILLDFDHYSDLTEEQKRAIGEQRIPLSTEAAGWINRLEYREEEDPLSRGLWGEVKLTPSGASAIEDRAFRFVSPLFLRSDCVALGGKRLRPIRLDSVAVTNRPNIRNMTALRNASDALRIEGEGLELETEAKALEVENQSQEGESMDYKLALIEILGLAPEATDEEIAAARTAAEESRKAALANSEAEAKAAAEKKAAEDAEAAKAAEALKNSAEATEKRISDLEKDLASTREELRISRLPNRAAAALPGEGGKGGGGEEKVTGLDRVVKAFRK